MQILQTNNFADCLSIDPCKRGQADCIAVIHTGVEWQVLIQRQSDKATRVFALTVSRKLQLEEHKLLQLLLQIKGALPEDSAVLEDEPRQIAEAMKAHRLIHGQPNPLLLQIARLLAVCKITTLIVYTASYVLPSCSRPMS